MDFFSALVRCEVGLWDAVDDELAARGLAHLHALQVVDRLAEDEDVEALAAALGRLQSRLDAEREGSAA